VVSDIPKRRDIQTNRHADVLIAIRRNLTEVEVIGNDKIEVFIGGCRIFCEGGGVTLGTRASQRASIEGVWAYERMKFERL